MNDRTRHAMQPLLALEFPVPIGPAGAQNMPGRGEPGPTGLAATANEGIEGQENGMMKKLTEPQEFAGQDTADAGRIGDYLYVRHTYASDELENLGIDHVFCKEVLPIPSAASDEEVSRFVDTVSLFERLDIAEDGDLGGFAGGCCSVAKGSHHPENRCAGKTTRDGTVGNPARNDGYATVIRCTWLFLFMLSRRGFVVCGLVTILPIITSIAIGFPDFTGILFVFAFFFFEISVFGISVMAISFLKRSNCFTLLASTGVALVLPYYVMTQFVFFGIGFH